MPKLRSDDDSERQTEDSDDDDSERQIENSGNDSERRNRGCNSEYRSENRRWLWTPKLKSDDGSERRTENSDDGSERRTENSDNDSERRNLKVMMVTLNVKLKNDNSSGSLIKKLTLNTKLEE